MDGGGGVLPGLKDLFKARTWGSLVEALVRERDVRFSRADGGERAVDAIGDS